MIFGPENKNNKNFKKSIDDIGDIRQQVEKAIKEKLLNLNTIDEQYDREKLIKRLVEELKEIKDLDNPTVREELLESLSYLDIQLREIRKISLEELFERLNKGGLKKIEIS